MFRQAPTTAVSPLTDTDRPNLSSSSASEAVSFASSIQLSPSFDLEPEEEFDPKYMRALFNLAYELSRDGYDWATSPPGIVLP